MGVVRERFSFPYKVGHPVRPKWTFCGLSDFFRRSVTCCAGERSLLTGAPGHPPAFNQTTPRPPPRHAPTFAPTTRPLLPLPAPPPTLPKAPEPTGLGLRRLGKHDRVDRGRPPVVERSLAPRAPKADCPQLARTRRKREIYIFPTPPSKRPALPGPLMGRCKTNKSSQGRADAQRLVATRLLDRLHDPLGHFSRLQRIYPRAR